MSTLKYLKYTTNFNPNCPDNEPVTTRQSTIRLILNTIFNGLPLSIQNYQLKHAPILHFFSFFSFAFLSWASLYFFNLFLYSSGSLV